MLCDVSGRAADSASSSDLATDDPGTRQPTLRELIRSDVEATTHPNFRLYGNSYFWFRAIAKLVLSANVRAVITYRIAHALALKGHLGIALLLRGRALRKSGAELNPQAKIGPGLYVVHSPGVVIGAFVEMGERCVVFHGATIGPQRGRTSGGWDYTKLGNNVTVGTHAVIMGGVTVGDGAMIGANAVVTKDVGPYEIVAGVPAVVVGKRTKSDAESAD
jgi:serine O-acetyltransferase